MEITFFIPAYNEARTIGEVLDRIAELDLDYEAIVIDDGSTDATADISPPTHKRASAFACCASPTVARAPRYATEFRTVEVISLSSRTQTWSTTLGTSSPDEPIRRQAADVVYGSRLSGGRPQRAYMFWHLVGNRFLSLMTGLMFNTTITDMETGYKAFAAKSSKSCTSRRTTRDRAGDHRRDLSPWTTIYAMPIAYYGRTYDEGKNITSRDGFRAIYVLIRTDKADPLARYMSFVFLNDLMPVKVFYE